MDFDILKSMFDMHIKECDQRDLRNAKSYEETKQMVKGLWDTMDATREKVVTLQVRIAYGLGALIVLSKIVEYGVSFLGHK